MGMQDRRQLCFILAVVGAVFALGSAFMTLAISGIVFGAMPFPDEAAFTGLMLLLFGWLTLFSAAGGVLMLVGGLKMRNATGQPLHSAATWAIVGGALSVLGGNVISAALGIVAGVLVLSEPPQPQGPPGSVQFYPPPPR